MKIKLEVTPTLVIEHEAGALRLLEELGIAAEELR